MLIGLTQALDDGGTLDLTLTFETGGDMVVTAPIRQAQMAAME
jgi:copper(I)-binding protein